MLGIILIIYIGRQFFKLAEHHKQNKWLFGILGVVCYYAGAIIGGGILGVLELLLDLNIDWDNDLTMTFISIPFSLGAVFLFYFLLKKTWSKRVVVDKVDEIQDIGKNTEDLENQS